MDLCHRQAQMLPSGWGSTPQFRPPSAPLYLHPSVAKIPLFQPERHHRFGGRPSRAQRDTALRGSVRMRPVITIDEMPC